MVGLDLGRFFWGGTVIAVLRWSHYCNYLVLYMFSGLYSRFYFFYIDGDMTVPNTTVLSSFIFLFFCVSLVVFGCALGWPADTASMFCWIFTLSREVKTVSTTRERCDDTLEYDPI